MRRGSIARLLIRINWLAIATNELTLPIHQSLTRVGDKLRQGVALPDALREFDVDLDRVLDSRSQLENAAAYLELHIEQGPVLADADAPLGVVSSIAGIVRSTRQFSGRADHAGTTPMDVRRDALTTAAEAPAP